MTIMKNDDKNRDKNREKNRVYHVKFPFVFSVWSSNIVCLITCIFCVQYAGSVDHWSEGGFKYSALVFALLCFPLTILMINFLLDKDA